MPRSSIRTSSFGKARSFSLSLLSGFGLTCVLTSSFCRSDTGIFSPGCVIAIDMPSPMHSQLGTGESSIPLLEVPNGMFVVDKHACNFSMPTVPVVSEVTRMHGFHLSPVQLKLVNLYFIDVPCTGRTCDALESYDEGNVAKMCGCFSIISRLSAVVVMCEVAVGSKSSSGEFDHMFSCSNFTSRKFTNLLVSEGGIPHGVSSTTINKSRRFVRDAVRRVERIFERVNNVNGWKVSGWCRRGYTRDANSSVQNNGSSSGGSASNHILASKLTHHAIAITPNKANDGTSVDFEEFRVPFNEFITG